MEELELEKKRLKDTIRIVEDVLVDEKDSLKNLYSNFIGSREDLWAIADKMKIHISNLELALDKPYFARIDFTSLSDGKTSTIYIGRNGVMHDNNIVITDWRAPISSLYYDAEVGHCSFETPGGIIEGDMTLKRQFEIEKGQLLEYFDVDLVSNDTLLQKYLNTNNDARLKTIVSTIQKEQNEVIRKSLFNNLIIQGVAGSGKTTVALHRIAYLVYHYMKSINQNQYLVIGPNSVFIKYISSVLPELDVSGVKQCTFEDFAKLFIGEEININSSNNKVNSSIMGKNKHDIDKFKCSMKYKDMINSFLNSYFDSLSSKDLKLGDFIVLPSNYIKEVFETVNSGYGGSLDSKIEQVIGLLCRYIEDNNDEIMSRYSDYSYELFKKLSSDKEKNDVRKMFFKEREEIRKNCKATLRKYFSKSKVNATKLYKLFISSISNYDVHGYKYLSMLKKETLANIKNDSYDFEDLAALMYIKKEIMPERDYDRIKHVVVDEAQDLGEFNFYILRKGLRSATFSIFGDLAQSIYDYRGIDNWDRVNDVMFDNSGEIVNFNKSYRTTSEIMDVADEVAESIGLNRSDLVVRSGEQVQFTQLDSTDEVSDYITGKIIEYKKKGYKTVAVISKTGLLSCYINDDLKEKGLMIPDVSIDDDLTDDRFKICTISNHLAKGLEFDAVIINNASEDVYSSKNALDMKLLYVALTRALHELDVTYTGELAKPLQKFVNEKKNDCKVLRK